MATRRIVVPRPGPTVGDSKAWEGLVATAVAPSGPESMIGSARIESGSVAGIVLVSCGRSTDSRRDSVTGRAARRGKHALQPFRPGDPIDEGSDVFGDDRWRADPVIGFRPVNDASAPAIGLGSLRPAPGGLPDPAIVPPTIAEAGDPFAAIRVIDLLARIERGRPVRIADIVDRLNATYLDWLFSPVVVTDVALQLQSNWMTDYRNGSGIALEDGPYGATIAIEDSSRVDPWIVRQARRTAASCTERLAEFSRRDRPTSGG